MLWDNASDYDMVVGERKSLAGADISRIPGKWLLGRAANIIVGRKIPDLNSGLRVYRKSFVMKIIHLMPDGFSFSSTSTLAAFKMGFSAAYFPVQMRKRIGKSNVKQVRHGTQVLMLILRLVVLFSPLRIFLPAAACLAFLGIVYEVYVLLTVRLMLANGALLLILTALIVFFFGLLVDQVSAMRRERYLSGNSFE